MSPSISSIEIEVGLSLDRINALGFIADAFCGEDRRKGNALGVVVADAEASLVRCLQMLAEIKRSAGGMR